MARKICFYRFLTLTLLVLAIASCGSAGKRSSNASSNEFASLEDAYKANPMDTSAIKSLGRAYAKAGRKEEALNLAVKLNAAVNTSSGDIIALYEQGMFSAEIYRLTGDEEGALMALEDARIFITRKTWGTLSEKDKALVDECLKRLAVASGNTE